MNLNDKQITRLRMIGYPIVTEKNQRVSDAIQWFRDEKGILCTVDMEYYDGIHYFGVFMGIGLKDGGGTEEFNNFPEAESALLDALLIYLEVKQ